MENWLLTMEFTKQKSLWPSRVVHLTPAGVGRCRRRWDDAQGRHVETDGLAQVSRNCSLTQIISNSLQQGEVLLIWRNKKRYVSLTNWAQWESLHFRIWFSPSADRWCCWWSAGLEVSGSQPPPSGPWISSCAEHLHPPGWSLWFESYLGELWGT